MSLPCPAIPRPRAGKWSSSGALIVLIKQDDQMLVPGGGTVLEPGDILHVVGESNVITRVRTLLESRTAPG